MNKVSEAHRWVEREREAQRAAGAAPRVADEEERAAASEEHRGYHRECAPPGRREEEPCTLGHDCEEGLSVLT